MRDKKNNNHTSQFSTWNHHKHPSTSYYEICNQIYFSKHQNIIFLLNLQPDPFLQSSTNEFKYNQIHFSNHQQIMLISIKRHTSPIINKLCSNLQPHTFLLSSTNNFKSTTRYISSIINKLFSKLEPHTFLESGIGCFFLKTSMALRSSQPNGIITSDLKKQWCPALQQVHHDLQVVSSTTKLAHNLYNQDIIISKKV